jgi:hypothetical protein
MKKFYFEHGSTQSVYTTGNRVEEVFSGRIVEGIRNFIFLIVFVLFATVLSGQNPGISLEQGANGKFGTPTSPVEWIRGNVNQQKGHLIENYAVPYRVIMTNLPLNQDITLEIGYDTKHGGRNALDFLTTYEHMYPHLEVYGHNAEEVHPWDGYFNEADAVVNEDKYVIPAPSSTGSPVPGQPTAEFMEHYNHSSGAHVSMSAFFGDITNIVYSLEQPLSLLPITTNSNSGKTV